MVHASTEQMHPAFRRTSKTLPSERVHVTLQVVGPLLLVVALLLVVSYGQELLLHLHPAFSTDDRFHKISLDSEQALGAWFSSVLMVLISIVLVLHGLGNRALSPFARFRWCSLGLLFFGLSADETVAIHEMGNGLRDNLGASGIFHFTWVVPALVFVLLGLWFYVPFIKAFPRHTRRLIVLSAALFLGGALGMEMLSGALISAGDMSSLLYQTLAHIEETLELLGLVTFLVALLFHSQEQIGPLVIAVRG